MDAKDLISACATALEHAWAEVVAYGSTGTLSDALSDSGLRDAIGRSVNSGTVTYRYVLPTQLLAKVADPSLDCRSVQVAAGVPGAFDARSLCHKVIVPFDR